MSQTSRIVVFGSLNMDLVLAVQRIPTPGETILGHNFQMLPGGKGANQAYAAARVSPDHLHISMAGKVGADVFGERLRANLASAGVDISSVATADSTATGVATITVDRNGQNAIVVASGANFDWTVEEAESLRALLTGAHFALFQLENPLPIVAALLDLSLSVGAQTILDPAPAQPLSRGILSAATYLTPNESEARILLGEAPGPVELTEAASLALRLQQAGARNVVLKLAEKGSLYLPEGATGESAAILVPAFPVQPVDTTAAGDTFNAAFAVGLGEGHSIPEAMRFANAAGAISVTRSGAQSSVPTRQEVLDYCSARRA